MKRILFLGVIITLALGVQAQMYFTGFATEQLKVFPTGGTQTVVSNIIKPSPAFDAGLWTGNVIIKANGVEVNEKNAASVLLVSSREQQTFTVVRAGGDTSTVVINPIKVGPNFVSEAYVAQGGWFDFSSMYSVVNTKANVCGGFYIDIKADPDVNLYKYHTFDFEFTSQADPLMEKQIAAKIEKYLQNDMYLIRDRENPELLVFIDFFADKKQTYVPPTQGVSTRYSTEYNWVTSQMETRQYIESTTKGNYTEVEYLTKFEIGLFDAQRMKAGAKVPPVVWRASYDLTTSSKVDIMKLSKNIVPVMLKAFACPTLAIRKHNAFAYTGLLFDAADISHVVGVMPGSPAAKAGIVSGDMITSVKGYGDMPRDEHKVTKLINQEAQDVDNFDYSTSCSEYKLTRRVYITQDYLINHKTQFCGLAYVSCALKNGARNMAPIVFNIKRGKEKLAISVNPTEGFISTNFYNK